MRFIYFMFLLAFTGAAAFLAFENQHDVTLTLLNKEVTSSVPVLVGLSYLAGMVSGWTVVGMIRRSISRVLERPLPVEPSYAR